MDAISLVIIAIILFKCGHVGGGGAAIYNCQIKSRIYIVLSTLPKLLPKQVHHIVHSHNIHTQVANVYFSRN